VESLIGDTENLSDQEKLNKVKTKYNSIPVAEAVQTAEAKYNELVTVVEEAEQEAEMRVEDSSPSMTTLLPPNAESYRSKAAQLVLDFANSSPGSVIGHGGYVASESLIPWILAGKGEEYLYRTLLRPGRVQTPLGAAYAGDQIGNPIFSGVGVMYDLVSSPPANTITNQSNVFEIELLGNSTPNYASFPPKPNCYSWTIPCELKIRFSKPAPLADLATYMGTSTPNITIGVGPFDGAKTLYSHSVGIPAGSFEYEASFTVNIPVSASSKVHVVDVYIGGALSQPLDYYIEPTFGDLVGAPVISLCDISEVDYIMESSPGVRQTLSAGSRWIDFFGKLKKEPNGDPNFSLAALWESRVSWNTNHVLELLGGYKDYIRTQWPNDPSSPSADDKYRDPEVGMSVSKGLLDMALMPSYIFSDGTFSGVAPRGIRNAINYFREDIRRILNKLSVDDSAAAWIGDLNAFDHVKLTC
jgi:hypothetical protein